MIDASSSSRLNLRMSPNSASMAAAVIPPDTRNAFVEIIIFFMARAAVGPQLIANTDLFLPHKIKLPQTAMYSRRCSSIFSADITDPFFHFVAPGGVVILFRQFDAII